jgi:hypothetical protein
MNTLTNKHDTLEQLIYTEGIRIQEIDCHPDMGMLLVLLNTGGVLQLSISRYPKLINVSKQKLGRYELIGKGTGVHWPDLDEDLSLKGMLRDTIAAQIISKSKVA